MGTMRLHCVRSMSDPSWTRTGVPRMPKPAILCSHQQRRDGVETGSRCGRDAVEINCGRDRVRQAKVNRYQVCHGATGHFGPRTVHTLAMTSGSGAQWEELIRKITEGQGTC